MANKARLWIIAILLLATRVYATDRYASTAGAGTTCSIGSPCTLATAITAGTSPAVAGDTIYIRAGTYDGQFICTLSGTSAQHIKVTNYPGEHVILDNTTGTYTQTNLYFPSGRYVDWIGTGNYDIEIRNTRASRPIETGDLFERPLGVDVRTDNIRLINLTIHDTGMGHSAQPDASAPHLLYGSLIYYNGNNDHCHGVYDQNINPTKSIIDNLIAFNAGRGLHNFSGTSQTNEVVQGNAIFGNGRDFNGAFQGTQALIRPRMGNVNYSYNSCIARPGASNEELRIGDDTGTSGPLTMQNNYWACSLYFDNITTGQTITGNTFSPNNGAYFPSKSYFTTNYPTNTWNSALPGSGKVFVYRPNQYEVGRCLVHVFNWDASASVNVDLAACGIANGTNYEIRNANNIYGSALNTGTYGGGTVAVTVSGLTNAAPVTLSTPTSYAPGFVVLSIRTTAGGAATATPTLTPSYTLTPTKTLTPTSTVTLTATHTFTNTPTSTASNTPVITSTPSYTASNTPTNTATITSTRTPTLTPTPQPLPPSFPAKACVAVAPMRMVTDVSAFGGAYVDSTADGRTTPASGGTLTCTFSVPTTGTYRTWVHLYAADGNTDSMYVEVDSEGAPVGGGTPTKVFDMGEAIQPCFTSPSCNYRSTWVVPPIWTWNQLNQREATCGPCLGPGTERLLNLTAGTHTIKFYGREIGARLDYVVLTMDMNYDPGQFPMLTPTATPTPGTGCKIWCKCNHKQGWVRVPCTGVKYGCSPCPFH